MYKYPCLFTGNHTIILINLDSFEEFNQLLLQVRDLYLILRMNILLGNIIFLENSAICKEHLKCTVNLGYFNILFQAKICRNKE